MTHTGSALIGVWALGLLMGFGLGLGRGVSTDFGQAATTQVPFSQAEFDADYTITLTRPIDIELRIASREQYEREKPTATALAFAYSRRLPCRIVVPEGWQIAAIPAHAYASWLPAPADSPGYGTILAHEILHCLRGPWHPR